MAATLLGTVFGVPSNSKKYEVGFTYYGFRWKLTESKLLHQNSQLACAATCGGVNLYTSTTNVHLIRRCDGGCRNWDWNIRNIKTRLSVSEKSTSLVPNQDIDCTFGTRLSETWLEESRPYLICGKSTQPFVAFPVLKRRLGVLQSLHSALFELRHQLVQ